MEREELQQYLGGLGSLTFEEGGEWINLFVESGDFRALMEQLRRDEQLGFDYLFCLTCVDFKTHLTMVYHLSSTRYRYNIVVKSKLDRQQPEIETVCDIWRTAEFHEREVYELFGVKFMNHPDLRLLILPEGWEGKNPLRKDFEDEVNMIKL
ncbi:MAG: NADH-quinone oxidoreductase subunit C [Sphingobacteriales bacterium]|nr:MAG: NADH-quinone oxidoreductase subunit C [Sphingobacteriales bacterium]